MTDKHRINRVITRSGDKGETGLADGSRLAKDAAVIEAMGDIDELNSALGVLRAQLDNTHQPLLESVQQRLFEMGAELALPGSIRISDEDVIALDNAADSLQTQLPPLKEFILPGGNTAASWCHYCRTLARRAERRMVRVSHQHLSPNSSHQYSANAATLCYLNRLSDLLFLMARQINRADSADEPQWQPR